jgi:hypothetical protein
MLRTRIPGFVDVIDITDPKEIRQALSDPGIDRQFDGRWPLKNGLLLRKLLHSLSIDGKRFPTMRPRGDENRAMNQELLWLKLNDRAQALTTEHRDVRELARWVQGIGSEVEIGILTQQAVGRLFVESYKSDDVSWRAALTLNQAPQAKGWTAISPWHRRRVRDAKDLLASKVDGDLAAVHGTGVALHNLVKGFHRMRELFGQLSTRSHITKDIASEECLYAPVVILRQAVAEGTEPACPYQKNTILLLKLREAQASSGAKDLVFLEKGWSRCPAEKWVPALLATVWECALAMSEPPSSTPYKPA